MSVTPLAIQGTGMVTSIGLNTASTCAAIHCAIDNFSETRFIERGGEWQVGAEVVLETPWRGEEKLLKMAEMCLQECLTSSGIIETDSIPLMLCLPEKDRSGRVVKNDTEFFTTLQSSLNTRFSPFSRVLCHGHTAALVAVRHSRELIDQGKVDKVLVLGVDSLLTAATLRVLQEQERLLTSENSNGLIPGEAASCILLGKQSSGNKKELLVHGVGFGIEKAYLGSGEPLRADGLRQALKASLAETGCEMHELDYRITDMTGEHYYFKEASLALSRTLRKVKPEFDILHPTDCVGEVGAAVGPAMLCYQLYHCEAEPLAGSRVMAHFSDTDGKRAAAVLSYNRGLG